MSYTIHSAAGVAITVPDNTIDTTYYNENANGVGVGIGIQLLGRNTINYGASVAQNFVQLTENFASTALHFPSDTTAARGQLWFNTSDDSLYVRITPALTPGGLVNWRRIAIIDPALLGNGNIYAFAASDTLTTGALNLAYPLITVGQFVVGPTVVYLCVDVGIWRVLSSGGGGGGYTPPILDVLLFNSVLAVSGTHYVLANVALTTVTLPAAPLAGDTIWVTVANGLTTNIIAGNGQSIMGQPVISSNMTINCQYATVRLRFVNSSWRLV